MRATDRTVRLSTGAHPLPDPAVVEFEVVRSPGLLTAWSVARLKFEPTGWQLAFRDELRTGLRELATGHEKSLSASYEAPDTAFVDLENVLLYNVGSGAFGSLLHRGVTCHRGGSADTLHRLRYEAVDRPQNPGGAAVLAEITTDLGTTVPHTAGQWWTLLRPAVRQIGPRPNPLSLFTLDVTVSTPRPGTRLGGMIKPLLDGLVASLHTHDGRHHDTLLPRLTALGDPDRVWARLVDATGAVLDSRLLLRPHGDSIAWNPADARCTAFRVRLTDGPRWHLTATVRAAR